ncbi:hypothetical protein PEBR_03352 [Penicillium brasilianum]|uniref:Uncharacterized protein n=1 Tax=Penicillium brasilianum TaxID=104259 RepID=A0A1S9RYX7_PENBI|nr:hypothetical protein PEBR_03352 [Penicillium brasilianum]
MGREGWAAAIVGSVGQEWDVERRFRVTEVALAIMWTLTFVYHATQNHATIKRETAASLLVVSVASFLSMSSLLLQLHLTRENEPEVPVFVITRKLWDWAVAIFLRMRVADGRAVGEL